MNLGLEELKWVEFVITQYMRDLRSIASVPPPVRALLLRVNCAIADEQTDPEPDGVAGDEIGTATAAEILGCTERWVRRIATDLDGIRVGRDWVFRRSVVEAYATARRAA
ncbi:helix-turn-helix domain-containing protein [Nocardia vinacea]|uniref:Helix-turn-helix domain-containing protein n=1 Tax=Nocardia vinacea TaxID=96468 RepID=A0ABZ1Z102_9NOCA|nr:helix-turn-helix domain-containing protein [Nocardia vinacea]